MDGLKTAAVSARSDAELLRDFATNDSEHAFAELFSRHVNWVYSVALRQVGNRSLAEDITQAVFAILARKAGSLKGEVALSGWLFRVVRYTAIDAMRMEFRRGQREQSFVSTETEEEQAPWEEVSPLLEECLAELRPSDQRAILLRFYERKPWVAVGAAFGLNENAARVRVGRALDKLKALLRRRGVTSTTSGLNAMLAVRCVESAPWTISVAQGGSTVTALVRAGLRRWFVRKLLLGSLVATLGLCAASFSIIPKSQNGPQEKLLGTEAFAALVDLDRAHWNGDASRFLSRIHFRDAVDEAYRGVLGQFVVAQAELRRAGGKAYRDDLFGYYESLDIILSGRPRPTPFGVRGKRAVGAFSRGRGIELVRIDGIWKWDFFENFPPARLEQIRSAIPRLQSLTERIASGEGRSEMQRELRSR